MRLLIKIPTRQRSEKFFDTLNQYRDLASGRHHLQYLISLDLNDAAMNTDEVKARLAAVPDLHYRYGTTKSKVDAFNRDMDLPDEWDILVATADDNRPTVAGYDDVIARDMTRWFPDLDGALHYNDGRMGDELCTHPIMGRRLYEWFGYVVHPAYRSIFCDNEYTEVCRAHGKIVYRPQVILDHAWIYFTGADDLHHHNRTFNGPDQYTYEQRRAAGYPREWP